MTTSIAERLKTTREALRQALEEQDWDAIGKLDQECRLVVNQVMLEPEPDTALLVGCMQDLLSLYRDMISACQHQRALVADEMRQTQRSRKGAQVYKLFG